MSFKLEELDHPSDSILKIYKKAMPLLGGVPISVGIIASLVIFGFLYETSDREITGLLVVLLFVLFLGLFNDIK